MQDIIQLAKAVGANIESYMSTTPKPIAVYFTIEQLRNFVESISNQREVILPGPTKVRDARNFMKQTEEVTIDLYEESWKTILQAADESPWIPEQYYMNEWVADVCSFLREPSSVVLPEQKEDLLTGQLASIDVIQASINMGWNNCIEEIKRLNNL